MMSSNTNLHLLCDRTYYDGNETFFGASWHTIQPLIERACHLFKFDVNRLSERKETPLHRLVSEEPPLRVVQILLHHDPIQAKLKNDDGQFPLEIACQYAASLDVLFELAEAHPAALDDESYKSQSASPISVVSFFSPIPFTEIKKVILGKHLSLMTPNLRKHVSKLKRSEILVCVKLGMKIDEVERPDMLPLRYGSFIEQKEIRMLYCCLRFGLTTDNSMSRNIFQFISPVE